MVEDTLLTEETFQVLKRVTADWRDERTAIDGIASAMHVSPGKVRASLEHLRRRHLVERRIRQTLQPCIEIRKIGR